MNRNNYSQQVNNYLELFQNERRNLQKNDPRKFFSTVYSSSANPEIWIEGLFSDPAKKGPEARGVKTVDLAFKKLQ